MASFLFLIVALFRFSGQYDGVIFIFILDGLPIYNRKKNFLKGLLADSCMDDDVAVAGYMAMFFC